LSIILIAILRAPLMIVAVSQRYMLSIYAYWLVNLVKLYKASRP